MITTRFSNQPAPNSGTAGIVISKAHNDPLPVGLSVVVVDKDGQEQFLWDMPALDFEGEDAVLLYTHDKSEPFKTTGDMLRVSRNRRWALGPSVASPKDFTSTYTFCCNPDTPVCIETRPWYRAKPYDAVKLNKWGEKLPAWLLFSREGDDKHCFRVGMTGDGSEKDPFALSVYASEGQLSSPENPGRLILRLEENGNLYRPANGTVKL